MLCLEAYGVNKLHSIEEPALVNEKQRKKEYYLNGIQYDYETWNELEKEEKVYHGIKNLLLKV